MIEHNKLRQHLYESDYIVTSSSPPAPPSPAPACAIDAGVAIPLHALAAVEQMPPLMTHASLVLHNWHRLDPKGPLCARNLACNSRFLGGQDETWFYTITVEIEARGGGIFGALLEVWNSAGGSGNTHIICACHCYQRKMNTLLR